MAKSIRSAPGAPVRTETRNSPIPRTNSPAPQGSSSKPAPARQISQEQIAKRAYEISQSPGAGSEFDNWIRAERELRSGK